MSGLWSDRFNPQRGEPPQPPPVILPPRPEPESDDIELTPDMSVYKPWTLQRGRSRPPLMLELRRYDAKAGFWCGWQLSYPSLIAVEYTGDRLLSLDFGTRQFAIKGDGFDELVRYLQQGIVVTLTEHAERLWPEPSTHSIITEISAR